MTFLNPGADALGAGYQITQSKIALGSGGLFGKGFLMGSQSQLNYLPEKQTDFVFTMIGEEFGLVGKTMHQVDENVEVAQIHQLKSIYTRILTDYFA